MNFVDFFIRFGRLLDNILFHEFFGFPFLVLLLIAISIFFSFYLHFPNIKFFKFAIKNSIKDNKTPSDKNNGLLKSKQSLFTSLSSVIGMGSIAGVATAIYVGGPGSIFWLIFMVLFSMNTSFAETLLAVKYRKINTEEKSIDCAPVSYIKGTMKDNGFLKFGIFLSAVYGVMYFIGLIGSQMYQVEEVVNLLTDFKLFKNSGITITILFDIFVLVVVYGGITKIAKMFEKLLPLVCGLYLFSVIIILIFNIKQIPLAFYTIIKEAFKLKSATGGIVGALCTGIKRGAYSNEAGLGAATTPYAAMESDNPIKQASIGSLNPFFVGIMCLATGLIIISSGVYSGNSNGIVLVSDAFGTVFSWFPYILSILIPLLSFSLCVSSTFNAQNVYQYYFGKKTNFIFIMVQFIMILTAAFVDLDEIIMLADTLYLSIALPNIICLFFSRNMIRDFYKENCAKIEN